jgi:hypothetical protein
LVVIFGAQTFANSLETGLWIAAGVGAVFVLWVVMSLDFYAQTSLGLVGTTIRRTGYFGHTVTRPREKLARVIQVTAVFTRSGEPTAWLLFLDAEDRPFLRAYAQYYSYHDLKRLKTALAVPWVRVSGVHTFLSVRRRYPGSVPWMWAHYWLTALGILAAAYFGAVFVSTLVHALS